MKSADNSFDKHRPQVIVSRASLTSLRTVSDNTILAKLTSVGSEANVRSEPT